MRVLQIGYGAIGAEVFPDYRRTLQDHRYMVTDLVKPVPPGYEYDGGPVDIAIVMVDTRPTLDPTSDGFDYRDLLSALHEYEHLAEFFVVRSTVGPDLFEEGTYIRLGHRIGFSPEFNGATKWSNRRDNPLRFEVFTHNVPEWFRETTTEGQIVLGNPREVSMAKLAENAFLALKVTFFHEMILGLNERGIDGEEVRRIVTHDPRIGEANSFMEEPGWTSHCYDKDVPAYARTVPSDLIAHAIDVNRYGLLPMREALIATEI